VVFDIEKEVTQAEKNDGPNPFIELFTGYDLVINAVGPSKMRDEEHTRIIDLVANKMIADAVKACNVDKLILVSSMMVTRPDEFVSFILNTMMGKCLAYKIEAENYIRTSGINYAIVRPGGLKGKKDGEVDMT